MPKDTSGIMISCETVDWTFKCPNQWDELKGTDIAAIRF